MSSDYALQYIDASDNINPLRYAQDLTLTESLSCNDNAHTAADTPPHEQHKDRLQSFVRERSDRNVLHKSDLEHEHSVRGGNTRLVRGAWVDTCDAATAEPGSHAP